MALFFPMFVDLSEKNILFVCRQKHLDSIPNMERKLMDI